MYVSERGGCNYISKRANCVATRRWYIHEAIGRIDIGVDKEYDIDYKESTEYR